MDYTSKKNWVLMAHDGTSMINIKIYVLLHREKLKLTFTTHTIQLMYVIATSSFFSTIINQSNIS